MFYVYVLKCRRNKYYIGEAINYEARFEEHRTGNGAKWTRKYKPICIEWVKSTNNKKLELAKTLQYMRKYGIDNVRGGPYCNMELPDWIIRKINYQLRRVCFRCGRSGHFAEFCDSCYRCGRRGHYAEDCCYKCGWPGHDPRFCDNCYKCGEPGHFARDCD